MKRWYALKVFYNRYAGIEATLARDGVESYIPMKSVNRAGPDGTVICKRVPLVAMLMFLRCEEEYIACLDGLLEEKAMVYHHPGTQIPASIPDEEMEAFIKLTSPELEGFDVRTYDPVLFQGAIKVRVVEGKYEGITGYLKRIKASKRLLVPVGDLLALVATDYIPQRFLRLME